LHQFEEWIRPESLKNHIEKSSVHKKSLERQTQTQQNPTIPQPGPSQPKDLQADDFATAQAIPLSGVNCGATLPHRPLEGEREMWDNFVATEDAFKIDQGPEESLQNARADFERKVKEFGLWGGLETTPEEDIGRLEDAWDEAEQDDILTEILQNLCQS
jgi:hypothetical protein